MPGNEISDLDLSRRPYSSARPTAGGDTWVSSRPKPSPSSNRGTSLSRNRASSARSCPDKLGEIF